MHREYERPIVTQLIFIFQKSEEMYGAQKNHRYEDMQSDVVSICWNECQSKYENVRFNMEMLSWVWKWKEWNGYEKCKKSIWNAWIWLHLWISHLLLGMAEVSFNVMSIEFDVARKCIEEFTFIE